MTDPAPVPPPAPPDPWWLKLIQDQHFKLALIYLFKTSGISSLALVQKFFPGVSPDTLTTYTIYGLPFVISFCIDWWRNNPNNLIKRGLMVFNGPKVTAESKASIVEAVSTVPGVKVKVNPDMAAPAVIEMAKSPDNNVKMDKPA